MKEVGTIINGNKDCMKPSISLQEAIDKIKQMSRDTLFELAWEAYSKERDYGYGWLNLMNGKFEIGHEHLVDSKNSYLILLRLSEEDFLFEWDKYDEATDYENYKDRLTLRDWCNLKGIDYQERIKMGVLRDPQRWSEYCELIDSKIYSVLTEWYSQHGVLEQNEKLKQGRVDERMRDEPMDHAKEKINYFLRDFKTLTLYKKAVELEDMIDKLAESFPADEKYRLTDQLIRCVTSIGANIAESNGGQYAGREKYHLGVAFQSANEARYWIERAFRKKYIDKVIYERLDDMAQELRRIMVGMFKRLDNYNIESA